MTSKIITTALILFLTFSLFAQKSNVGKAVVAMEEGDFPGAYTAIMKALDPENPKASKTINWPRTWIVKGEILTEIGRIGFRNIVNEPLLEANDAFMKAIELDEKGRFAYTLIPNLDKLQLHLSNYGKTVYGQRKFDIASRCFLTYMEIEYHPFLAEFVDENLDTVITYNAGLAAFEGKKWQYVIDYFTLAENNGCVTPVGKYCIASAYKEMGDTVTCIQILEESQKAYPTNKKISAELIDLFLHMEENEKALTQIELSLKQDPKDIVLLMRKGRILEGQHKENEAIQVYMQATEFDAFNFTPFYNLGVIYFNKGVSIINNAIDLPDSEEVKYLELTKKGNQHLELCLPYFEKAYQLKPNETNLLKSLSYIYKQLEMTDKYEEAERKLKI